MGDHVIADADGTPVLLQVTAVSAPNVTFAAAASPLAADDTFIAIHYLPDTPAGQEGRAIVNYNGSLIVKLGDIDWSLATGISLASPYTPANGTLAAGDTLQLAIEKLDGNQLDLITLSGVAQGAVDLGTFTGATIPDSSTVKGALQSLETAHEEVDQNVNDLITLSGVAENATNLGTFTGSIIPDNQTVKQALQALETEVQQGGRAVVAAITAAQTVDSVLVDSVAAVKWYVQVSEDAAPANVKAFEVFAAHNGHAGADATGVDDTVYAAIKRGSNFNLNLSVDISGTGAAQVMRLRASSSSAGVTVRVKREEVRF